MKGTIFLTGGTGLLGAHLLKTLKKHKMGSIVALSRGSTKKEAEERIYKALQLKENQANSYDLEIVQGDITKHKMGLSQSAYKKLTGEAVLIYHCAASCDFRISLSEARRVNVAGTKNVLQFALQCMENGVFKGVHYISTAAVAGTKRGVFYEEDLDVGQGFNNAYEKSKFEAEQAIIKFRKKGLSVTVYRPGIVSGHSRTGYTSNFRVFYQPLHFFNLELFREIPADENSVHYFTPVDLLAESIYLLSIHNCTNNKTYHSINPHGIAFGIFLDAASKYFGFKKPKMILPGDFDKKSLTPLQWTLIEPYVPYFNYKVTFDSTNAQSVLNNTSLAWPDVDEKFFNTIFNFCNKSSFIKRKNKRQYLKKMAGNW